MVDFARLSRRHDLGARLADFRHRCSRCGEERVYTGVLQGELARHDDWTRTPDGKVVRCRGTFAPTEPTSCELCALVYGTDVRVAEGTWSVGSFRACGPCVDRLGAAIVLEVESDEFDDEAASSES